MHLRETIRKPPFSHSVGNVLWWAVALGILAGILGAMKTCHDERLPPEEVERIRAKYEGRAPVLSVQPPPYKSVHLAAGEWTDWMVRPVGASQRWYFESRPSGAKVIYEAEFVDGRTREFFGNQSTGKTLSELKRLRYRNVSDVPITLDFFCDCADQSIAREVEAERDRLSVASKGADLTPGPSGRRRQQPQASTTSSAALSVGACSDIRMRWTPSVQDAYRKLQWLEGKCTDDAGLYGGPKLVRESDEFKVEEQTFTVDREQMLAWTAPEGFRGGVWESDQYVRVILDGERNNTTMGVLEPHDKTASFQRSRSGGRNTARVTVKMLVTK